MLQNLGDSRIAIDRFSMEPTCVIDTAKREVFQTPTDPRHFMVFQNRHINQHINPLRNDLGIPGASTFVFSTINTVFLTLVKYFVVISDTLCVRGKGLHLAFILFDGVSSVQEMVFKPIPDDNLFFEDTRAVYSLNNLINNNRMRAELRSTERVDFYPNDVVGEDNISPRSFADARPVSFIIA